MGNVRYLKSYRSDRERLVYLMTRVWRRRKTQQALQANYQEITTLRMKVRNMANELNEWRWKVGGAAYDMSGEAAKQLVAQGMRDKGYPMERIEDADLRPIEMDV